MGGSTAAEVKSGIWNGTDDAGTNFVLEKLRFGMLAEQLMRGCKILPSL